VTREHEGFRDTSNKDDHQVEISMHETRIRMATVAVLTALLLGASAAASAQSRLSLADRVARLEAQTQGSGQGQAQGQIDLLNRIEELQSEVQGLRNVVEQQQFEIENLKRVSADRPVAMGSTGASFGSNPAETAPPPEPGPGGLVGDPIVENLPPPTDAAPDAMPEAPPAAANPGDERAMYDQAFAALRDGRYAESARLFRAFLDAHPNGELAPNALYWLGESYYVTQNFQIALDTFDELLTRFPQSPKAQDALLKVGYCHYELKQWPEAERALNEVVQRYPDTTVARLAQGRLRALRLDAERR
jgi:tol-pal system protein YbgF